MDGVRGYDPTEDLRRVIGSVYWAHGAQNRSIPASRSAAIARALIELYRRPDWRDTLLSTGDHNLFDATTHQPLDVFPAMQQWLAERLR